MRVLWELTVFTERVKRVPDLGEQDKRLLMHLDAAFTYYVRRIISCLLVMLVERTAMPR